MKKADYSKIAATYDMGRRLLDQNVGLWMDHISRFSEAGARALDLGCGTGRFSLPMAVKLGFEVTGADSSLEMLNQARAKDTDGRIQWVCQDAGSLAFRRNSFDLIFLSHLLHHVDDPPGVVKSCHGIMADGGVILVRYGAIEDIREDPEHTFFPGVSEIDEARTPSVIRVESLLKDAGFSEIESETVAQMTYETPKNRLEAAKVKSTSVLSMIKPDEFVEGLRQMESYILQHPEDLWLTFDRITITAGHK